MLCIKNDKDGMRLVAATPGLLLNQVTQDLLDVADLPDGN